MSVLVPTLNSERTIEKLLDSIQNQDFKDYELILIDGDSNDKTLTIAKRYPVKIIEEERKGIGAARRTGVLHAKGVYVAFIDSDCRALKNWLRSLLSVIKNVKISNVVGVGGSAVPEDESLVSKCLEYRWFTEAYDDLKEVESIATFNAIYTKDMIIKAGNFNPDLEAGEDLELNHRIRKLGFKLLYVPRIRVYHNHPTTVKELLRKWFHHGRWFARVHVMSSNFLKKIFPRLIYCLCLAISILTAWKNLFILPVLLFLLPSSLYLKTALHAFRETKSVKILFSLPIIHNLKIQAHNLGIIYYFITRPSRIMGKAG